MLRNYLKNIDSLKMPLKHKFKRESKILKGTSFLVLNLIEVFLLVNPKI